MQVMKSELNEFWNGEPNRGIPILRPFAQKRGRQIGDDQRVTERTWVWTQFGVIPSRPMNLVPLGLDSQNAIH